MMQERKASGRPGGGWRVECGGVSVTCDRAGEKPCL